MEYLRGWRALRRDPRWLGKIGVASVILLSGMCLPFVGQIVLVGWNTLILRRAVQGQDAPLPRLELDVDYLTKLLTLGFKGFLARFLWSLPLAGVAAVSACCFYAAVVGAAVAASESAGATGDGDARVGLVVVGLGVVFFVVYLVLMLVGSIPIHIATLRTELTDNLNFGIRFKEVLAATRLLWKELLLGSFVMLMIGMLGGILSVLTLYLGLFPIVAVINIVVTHWYAELYRVYLQKGGEPLPVGPLEVEAPPPSHPPAGNPPQSSSPF